MGDARETVWTALADLFLDTDVRIWYAHLARRLAESPFSIPELRDILDNEVTPALQDNLLDIAGEWAGFDDAWVIGEVRRMLGKRHTRKVNMDGHWTALAHMVELLRQTPAAETMARTRAWDVLMKLFLNKTVQGRTLQPPEQYSLADLERFFRQDLWPVLIEDARRLAGNRLQIYPTENEIEANWTQFAADFGRPA